jgi:hypothetical protein
LSGGGDNSSKLASDEIRDIASAGELGGSRKKTSSIDFCEYNPFISLLRFCVRLARTAGEESEVDE